MSLILEALKKSEQQRRIGQVPNLGTPVIGTRRRRGRLLPVLVSLIVVALAIGAWLRFGPATDVPAAPAADPRVASADAPPAPAKPPGAKPSETTPAPAGAPPAAAVEPGRVLSAYERERLRITGELPRSERKPRPPVSRAFPTAAPPAAPPAASPCCRRRTGPRRPRPRGSRCSSRGASRRAAARPPRSPAPAPPGQPNHRPAALARVRPCPGSGKPAWRSSSSA